MNIKDVRRWQFLTIGSLSKLTRRPRGGGHIQISIQLRVIYVKGRVNSLSLRVLLKRNLLVDRRLSAASSVCLSSLMKAAETLCLFCLPLEEHISWKKYLGNRPSKKSHFIRVWPSNLYLYGYFKNSQMNFFQNSSLGSTPLALLIWLQKILQNRHRNWNISNKHKYVELFESYIWFFFGPITYGSIPICTSKKFHIGITFPFHLSWKLLTVIFIEK